MAEYLAELHPVVGGSFFFDQAFVVYDFLEGQQDLVGVDGFDEVVADLGAEGFFHDGFGLVFGDHDDGHIGVGRFQAGEGFQPGDAGHALIQENDVDGLIGFTLIEGIMAVGHLDDVVAFFFQKEELGFEQFDLVVGP